MRGYLQPPRWLALVPAPNCVWPRPPPRGFCLISEPMATEGLKGTLCACFALVSTKGTLRESANPWASS